MSLRGAAREVPRVVIVAYLIALGIQAYRRSESEPPLLVRGDPFKVSGANFRPRRLVVAVSENCPYSRVSIPFHKQVLAASHRVGLSVLLIMDTTPAAGNELVREINSNDQLIVAGLRGLRITGTPTILMVEDGKVSGRWTGELSRAEEAGLLSRVDRNMHTLRKIIDKEGHAGSSVQFTSAETVQQLRGAHILDIRIRDQWSASSVGVLAGAANIPADELPVRMKIELPNDGSRIVLDCTSVEEAACVVNASLLKWGGFTDVWLYDPGMLGANCANTPTWKSK